ncbi:Leucine rich repeat N-terminal domain [Seminavis robusta]|uniref:Leucine rich repeat N-terminal domain n=1 Tax=Seminavis robusta TaxID=568900 RepID=A0A9N8EUA0_9STRA|nr:Leucine rich repeat N-terminal domain [Seminavis robusta]|eukprot:Sro1704_g292360.1 Leucine rich repeat N-terminal domain (882) ;mRNA; r:4416-7324
MNKETDPSKPVAGLNTTASSSSGNNGTVDPATLDPPTTTYLDRTMQGMAEERAAKEASRASMDRSTGTGTTGIVASGIPGAVLEISQKRQKEAKQATTDGLVDITDARKPPATARHGLKRSVEEKAAKVKSSLETEESDVLQVVHARSPGDARREVELQKLEQYEQNQRVQQQAVAVEQEKAHQQPRIGRQTDSIHSRVQIRTNRSATNKSSTSNGPTNEDNGESLSIDEIAKLAESQQRAQPSASASFFCPKTISENPGSSTTTATSTPSNIQNNGRQQIPLPAGAQPGAYSGAPGMDLQRANRPCFSLLGVASTAVEPMADLSAHDGCLTSINADREEAEPEINNYANSDSNGLAVAALVEEDEMPQDLPRAAEFDVDELRRRKEESTNGFKTKIYIIVGLLVVFGIIVAGVCGSGHCSSKEELSPRDMEGIEIKAQLEKVLGHIYFDGSTDNTEPHQKALKWIIHQDPRQLPPDSNHLLQRFVLTQFYFSTSQASPWKFCGAASGAQTDVCQERHLSNQFFSERWLSGVPECRWAGCSCEGENITEVDIWDNSFTGSLPSELGLLSHAISLSFRFQDFTGTIPTEMYQLKALTNLDLSENSFTGTINPAVFSMPSLGVLHFWGNHMTGTIPTEVGLFQGEVLFMHTNSFTGTIPSELFSANKVRFFYFGDNKLSGTIPTEVGLLSQQVHLDTNADFQPDSGPSFGFARNNALSGTIPSEFGLVDKLSEFNIGDTRIGGTIPEELILNCLNLWFLRVENCNLGGTLSTNLGLLTNLRFLLLANNNFSGSIPVELEALTLLEDFTINGNPELRGGIPDGMCFESSFSAQGLEFVADCAPTTITASDGTTSTGEPLVSCPEGCCSACCDGGTGICTEEKPS